MEAEGNRPTAANYAWAEARDARIAAESVGTRFREALTRLELAEEKLKYIGYIEQVLDGAVTLVEAELVRKDLKAVLDAETLEDLRALRD